MNKTKIFDRRSIFFAFVGIILYGLLIFILLSSYGNNTTRTKTKDNLSWNSEKQRALANKLKGVGLLKDAARAYETYISDAHLTPKERSTIAYTIAQIYMDAKDYERALIWLYQVEISYPDTDLKANVSSKIVTCLENTKHFKAAEYALSARSSREQESKKEEKGGIVIAKIGNDEITLNEINKAMEDIPPRMREEIKIEEFAIGYIADQLFYRKGIKLGYDQDLGVRDKIERLSRQLIIGKVKEETIDKKIKAEPDDIQNFFKANKEKYQDPNSQKELNFDTLKDRVKADYINQKRQISYQKYIEQAISNSDVHLFLDKLR